MFALEGCVCEAQVAEMTHLASSDLLPQHREAKLEVSHWTHCVSAPLPTTLPLNCPIPSQAPVHCRGLARAFGPPGICDTWDWQHKVRF